MWILLVALSAFQIDLAAAVGNAIVPTPRSYSDWLTSEVVIPGGKHEGNRFSYETQPFTRLLADEIDRQSWQEIVITGPSQSGKTTIGFLGPMLHVVAELREKVVVALPDLAMTRDKYRIDIEPIMRSSPRLRPLIPTTGAGSRGGMIDDLLLLTNGSAIKFMTRGGSDASKAGFPGCRFLCVTEAHGFSSPSETSAEADPFRQIKARLASYDVEETRTIIEGTVALAHMLPWSLRANSTRSRIACPCVHCGVYVTPEREHFAGWEEAADEFEAKEKAAFHCPACGQSIDDNARYRMNAAAKLVHEGQTIDKRGRIRGEPPRTSRLWFRWTAFNNMLLKSSTFAFREWEAAQIPDDTQDRDNAEKSLCQFTWCVPYEPPQAREKLTITSVRKRAANYPKGVLPPDTQYLTVGLDLRKREGHWCALASREQSKTLHVPEYGIFPIASDELGTATAMLNALREFREQCAQGWLVAGTDQTREPDAIWIDAGYQGEKDDRVVYRFCYESNVDDDSYLPAWGYGTENQRRYNQPKNTSKTIVEIGPYFYLQWHADVGLFEVHIDANAGKSSLQERLLTPAGAPGSIALYESKDRHEHTALGKHLTSEEPFEEFIPGIGLITKWVTRSKANHWLDALYRALAAQFYLGYSAFDRPTARNKQDASTRQGSRITTPDGRAYVATER